MIPYFTQTVIHLGPLPIQVWGTMVALGIAVGLWVSGKRAEKLGLNKKIVYDLGTYAVIAAMVGARVVHSFVYEIGATLQDPLEFFRVWHGGFSVMGGFIGACLMSYWYLRKHHVDVWRYADATIFGLPIGLGIGRIGCFLIHDHPGTASDFILAVQYPDGVARHDHGLYLSLNGFAMALVFWWMSRRRLPVGAYLAVFGVWYGAVRFWLDFYRTIDTRYFGLTPAQYVSVAMFGLGLWGIWKCVQSTRKKSG
ncbi:prolipoprotein diacylglyceryl transferase [Candidatus Uhrbacteria bacterium CG10_big_fil_rev_8_21_14_0_10_50_16]|uniref:Phosphatidylglycerol--prolipoprotein diacylglyceryl transferase n=1 Tax=Candidatus Uhrbacteria bacterium CG10_big_fil_rev_8_21_14_0_10_50_16 TaxID=1975039 RepID=A0A2H0RMP0_9BACT|nr:MAG: prolipoprotein diacylglyceryl transferase [Candidatus Uhrbacteria bacterium CG10_big_fil_rev_8_21_14_0_10_50_16]